jgi:hypothetical protein
MPEDGLSTDLHQWFGAHFRISRQTGSLAAAEDYNRDIFMRMDNLLFAITSLLFFQKL